MKVWSRWLVLVMGWWAIGALASEGPRDAMQHFFHQSFLNLPDEVATACFVFM